MPADPCVAVTVGHGAGQLVLAYWLGVAMGAVSAWWVACVWRPARKAVAG